MITKRTRQRQAFNTKKKWSFYLLLMFLKGFCLLPFGWRLALGRMGGALIVRCHNALKRKKPPIGWLTRQNLRIAFPEWSEERLNHEVNQTGARLGEGIIHVLNAWFGRNNNPNNNNLFINPDTITQGLSKQRGLILLVWHDFRIETVGRAFHAISPLSAVFNPSTSPLLNQITYAGRQSLSRKQIPSFNLKELLSALNDNHTVAYLVDQGRLRNNAIKTTMFGQDFYVDPLLPKLLRDYKASLVTASLTPGRTPFPVSGKLLPDTELRNDDNQLCQTLIDQLGHEIRKNYTHYLWEAKMFKQPKGKANPYAWP